MYKNYLNRFIYVKKITIQSSYNSRTPSKKIIIIILINLWGGGVETRQIDHCTLTVAMLFE